MRTLYLIPVPIADDAMHTLPDYVLDTVRRLDFFIAERAKTARHFLKAAGIGRPLQEIEVIEIDERDPASTATAFLEALKSGRDIGLMSEAGCPGVADPGAAIVALAHREQVRVVPLVGPSSILLALMASGMNGQQFAFNGYLSPKRAELAKDLRRLEQLSARQRQTQIFIETPYRCQMVMEVALESLQDGTRFCMAQDISGASEFIKSQKIRDWKQSGIPEPAKLPAVFLLEGV
jgi:16S rRNA (cytidine1402-2'-O)-methyltransferase